MYEWGSESKNKLGSEPRDYQDDLLRSYRAHSALCSQRVGQGQAGKMKTRRCLDTVQRGFPQKIIKSYRTVSLNAALVLSGLIPLDLRAREVSRVYEAKHGRPQDFLWGRKVEKRTLPSQTSHPSEELEMRFGCLEDLRRESVDGHDLTGMIIYTDWSKIGSGVGAAHKTLKAFTLTPTLVQALTGHGAILDKI